MRTLVSMGTFAALILSAGVAQADVEYKAPFENVKLPIGSTLRVAYEFNSHTTVLHCKTDSKHSLTTAEYTYKDVVYKVPMPVTLKDDKLFAGEWADPEGIVSISNQFGSDSADGSLLVSCTYHSLS